MKIKRTVTKSSRDKVRAYRERLRQQGLRPIQIWVPDVRSAKFAVEAHRQSMAIARSAKEKDDQAFIDSFLAASKRAGEKMWQMPMDDEYRDLLKSTVADVANTGGRFAGMITAAKFLQEFVGDTPWVHLDIESTPVSPIGRTKRE